MGGFFKLCEIDMDLNEITSVIKEFTNDEKRNYLTAKDLKKIIGKDSLLESKFFDKKR